MGLQVDHSAVALFHRNGGRTSSSIIEFPTARQARHAFEILHQVHPLAVTGSAAVPLLVRYARAPLQPSVPSAVAPPASGSADAEWRGGVIRLAPRSSGAADPRADAGSGADSPAGAGERTRERTPPRVPKRERGSPTPPWRTGRAMAVEVDTPPLDTREAPKDEDHVCNYLLVTYNLRKPICIHV